MPNPSSHGLNASHAGFLADITQFIQTYWSQVPGSKGSIPRSAEANAQWYRALVDQGWSVPQWPEEHGGTNWDPTQRFLWQRTCLDYQVDSWIFDDPGIALIGPLLLQAPPCALYEEWIDEIRSLRMRWCLGFAEPEWGLELSGLALQAQPHGQGICLNGTKVWVTDTDAADWLCCLVRAPSEVPDASVLEQPFVLCAVPLNHAGVKVIEKTTFDGVSGMADIILDHVVLPAEHIFTVPNDGQQYAQWAHSSVMSSLTKSAVATAQLAQLDAQLHDLSDTDPMYTARHEVAVELAALKAMELRFVDALQRNIEPHIPIDVLRIKSRAILLQLGALQMQCFGYYALPYPNEVLLHNEGPIGPVGAVEATRSALAARVSELYEGSIEAIKDRVAEQLEIDTPEAQSPAD